MRFLGALFSIFAISLATAVMLEGSLRLAAHAGYFKTKSRATAPDRFYQDSDPVFGVWHQPNSDYEAESSCFRVTYRSNSWGMRDQERLLDSDDPRVAILGDSFVEGIGVERGERLTDLLEARTDIEHLNFGTAGNFSSVQQWLLHETLASRFEHDLVLLFMLPDNDFIENDMSRFWEPNRYRPYLLRNTKSDPNQGASWTLHYPVTYEEAQDRARDQLSWNRWYNRFFVYRFFSWVESQVRVRRALGSTSGIPYSGYSDFSREDFERLAYSYQMLLRSAEPRHVVVFTIPRLVDFIRHREGKVETWLPDDLGAFSATEPRLSYVDLLPGFLQDLSENGRQISDYFHPCDGHWSALGNQVAAQIVLDSVGQLFPYRREARSTPRKRNDPPR